MLTPMFPSYNMLMVYAAIFGLAIGKFESFHSFPIENRPVHDLFLMCSLFCFPTFDYRYRIFGSGESDQRLRLDAALHWYLSNTGRSSCRFEILIKFHWVFELWNNIKRRAHISGMSHPIPYMRFHIWAVFIAMIWLWNAGMFYDATKNYDYSFFLSGSMILLSAILCYPLGYINRWEKAKKAKSAKTSPNA